MSYLFCSLGMSVIHEWDRAVIEQGIKSLRSVGPPHVDSLNCMGEATLTPARLHSATLAESEFSVRRMFRPSYQDLTHLESAKGSVWLFLIELIEENGLNLEGGDK